MRNGTQADTARNSGTVLLGVGLALALHFAFAAVCLTFGSSLFEGPGMGLWPLMWIGGTQWLYLAPAGIVAAWRKRWRTLVGLLCAGGVTIVFNIVGLWLALRGVG